MISVNITLCVRTILYAFPIEKPGICPNEEYSCMYPMYNEMSYKCVTDSMCPGDYKCCYHSCYCHKVCLQAVVTETTTVVQAVTASEDESSTIFSTDSSSTAIDTQPEESKKFFSINILSALVIQEEQVTQVFSY